MKAPRLAVAAVVGCMLACATPAFSQCPASETRYSILELPPLGGTTSFALQLNEAGHVVGTADDAVGHQRPTVWEDGIPTDLGGLGGPNGFGSEINDVGQVAGQADALGHRRAFLWENGSMMDIGSLAGLDSRAFGLNDAGVVVGISNAGAGFQHAFRWEAGVMEDLGLLSPTHKTSYANGINDSGVIAGWSGPAGALDGAQAWRRDGGPLIPLGTLGGTSSVPFGIDNSGRIVGWSFVAGDTVMHAYVWENGIMTDLGTLGGEESIAYGSNPAGDVVGYAEDAGNVQRAAIWSGGPAVDLDDLIPADSGWSLTTAASINTRGQIAGWGTIGGATRGFLATPAAQDVQEVIDIVDALSVPPGVANSLRVKLQHAQAGLDGCDTGFACQRLGTFVSQVEALAGKQLSDAEAAELLAEVEAIRTTLSCP